MLRGKENGHSQGAGVKYALESLGNVAPVYEFLRGLGITTGIVKMAEAELNGHHILRTWIGTGINTTELSRKSVLEAGGTGSLEIVGDGGNGIRTEVFVQGGHIIRETQEPKGEDPKQVQTKMNI